MLYGIRERKGFVAITGEIGTGKTTLCKALLRQLDPTTKTALILHSGLSELQLLQTIVQDLGLNPMRQNRLNLFSQLSAFLLEQASLGHNTVLIIDEAQNLTPRVLEQIRMLSNLETDKDKLLQIILVGQPQLHEKLNLPSMRQIQQRISVRYHIQPLEHDEVGTYIAHRMQLAGSDGRLAWTAEAVEEIARSSGGVPRLINAICDRSLLCCYVLQVTVVDGAIARRGFQELMGEVILSEPEVKSFA